MKDQIIIPRKGGPCDAIPYKCPKSVFENLKEEQCFGIMYRERNWRDFMFTMGEAIYRLQKDNNERWELVYVEPSEANV